MVAISHTDSTATAGAATTPSPEMRAEPVLQASGIETSYQRGIWPLRHTQQVLRGADLTLRPSEVVGPTCCSTAASPTTSTPQARCC